MQDYGIAGMYLDWWLSLPACCQATHTLQLVVKPPRPRSLLSSHPYLAACRQATHTLQLIVKPPNLAACCQATQPCSLLSSHPYLASKELQTLGCRVWMPSVAVKASAIHVSVMLATLIHLPLEIRLDPYIL